MIKHKISIYIESTDTTPFLNRTEVLLYARENTKENVLLRATSSYHTISSVALQELKKRIIDIMIAERKRLYSIEGHLQ